MFSFKTFLAEQENIDPEMKTWSIDQYYQAGFAPVVFAIGKFNPPHVGHHQIVDQLNMLASKLNAQPIVFVVDTGKRTQSSPLDGERRIHYLQKMFPGIRFELATNAYVALVSLLERQMLPVGEVTGSDRSYRKDIGRIFGENVSQQEKYIANPILRDEALGGVLGASSSKMREAILNNNHQLFKQLTGLSTKDADELFNEVTSAMGL